MQLVPTQAQHNISAQHALQVYVASAGLIFLALERLNKHYYPDYNPATNPTVPHLTELDIYNLLSAPTNLAQLQELTRAQIIMRTFEAANQALQVTMARLAEMEPFEASKTATTLITKLEELTNNHKQEINVNQFVWENVIPDEAAAAINYLKAASQHLPEHMQHADAGFNPSYYPDQVIEHQE